MAIKLQQTFLLVLLTLIVIPISFKYMFSNTSSLVKQDIAVDDEKTVLTKSVGTAVARMNSILSQKYIAELEATRRKLLQTSVIPSMKPRNVTVLDGNKHTHFMLMLNDQRVKVHNIWFSERPNILAPPMVTKYYNGITTDCSIYRRRAPYDSKCFTRPEDVEQPFSLSKAIEISNRFSRIFGITKNQNTKDISPSELLHDMTYITIITGAFLNELGEVIKDNWKIVPRSCHDVPHIQYFQPKKWYRRYREVFALAQAGGYLFYHFLIENLTRIAAYVSFLKRHPNIKILVNVNNSFNIQFLAGLGIAPSRLVSGEIRADIVYMPAGTPCSRAMIFNSQFLSMQLRAAMSEPDLPRDTVILIRRSEKRWFDHHHDILAMLQKQAASANLTMVVYGDDPVPGFNETRYIFNRAYLVVAPHGAGESNLIFSQPGTILVEGVCYDDGGPPAWCYRHLMLLLGHRYCGMMFKKQCIFITAKDIEPVVKYYINKLKN